jgi:hypothetical protein
VAAGAVAKLQFSLVEINRPPAPFIALSSRRLHSTVCDLRDSIPGPMPHAPAATGDFGETDMKMLISAALAAATCLPAFAAQPGDLTTAITTLSAIHQDAAKRKAYCELQDLLTKAEDASDKNEDEQAKTLAEQADQRSKSLGPDFQVLTKLDADVDPTSEQGQKYFDAWEALEKSCIKA